MQTFPNSFVGIVDILGYSDLEAHLDQFGAQVSGLQLGKVFDSLARQIARFDSTGVVWTRYGDGWVFHSPDAGVDYLAAMVKSSCSLIALALNQSIPLRIAITQDSIKVSCDNKGTTITGSGWDVLQKIEKCMDWMGGVLYLPSYDGSHHSTVQNLVAKTFLVRRQVSMATAARFEPPIKPGAAIRVDKSWFLNWQRCLNQPKSTLDASVESWWSEFRLGGTAAISEEVRRKQEITIRFADYCRELRDACNLLYFADVCPDLRIGDITGF